MNAQTNKLHSHPTRTISGKAHRHNYINTAGYCETVDLQLCVSVWPVYVPLFQPGLCMFPCFSLAFCCSPVSVWPVFVPLFQSGFYIYSLCFSLAYVCSPVSVWLIYILCVSVWPMYVPCISVWIMYIPYVSAPVQHGEMPIIRPCVSGGV